MRFKTLSFFLSLALVACAANGASAQDEEETVRGSFLTTRVTASTGSGNPTSAAITASANTAAGKTTPSSSRTGRRRAPVKPVSKKPASKTHTSGSVAAKGSIGQTDASVKAGAS